MGSPLFRNHNEKKSEVCGGRGVPALPKIERES
jgi:hypothetical protein